MLESDLAKLKVDWDVFFSLSTSQIACDPDL